MDSFITLAMSAVTTADTFKTLYGFIEGYNFYWRIKATNLGGECPWSTTDFTTILFAPTNLTLQNNESNEIILTWKDNSDVEKGYVIERKLNTQTTFVVIDTLKGTGTEYVDSNLAPGQVTYTYRIKAYGDFTESDNSNEASITITGIKDEKGMPKEYSISQNYPNPFNPTTNIKFALPKRGKTMIAIYDLLGRELYTLIDKELEAGYHEISFDANVTLGGFTSGVYFYRIHSSDFNSTKKMILMK